MKIVCDGCGAIVGEAEYGRVDIVFPTSHYRDSEGNSLDKKIYFCFDCVSKIKLIIEEEVDAIAPAHKV